jgi:hypothetical protein
LQDWGEENFMKIVRVHYTAKEYYVNKNCENFAQVMEELRTLNNPGIKYSVYKMEDGKTFMHLAQYENEEMQKIHNALPSFKKFTSELMAKGLETQPFAENPTLVGSSYDIF